MVASVFTISIQASAGRPKRHVATTLAKVIASIESTAGQNLGGAAGTGPDQHEDLVAVIPADGYVNNSRAQLPLGPVISATYTSSNGSKRGLCNVAGSAPGSGCFEPPDSLKGDFARIYFYMAVRYEGELDCCAEPAVNGADIVEWQETMLRDWHAMDPVDIPERTRNEDIFGIQRNRNPFVDYPAFVDRIEDF